MKAACVASRASLDCTFRIFTLTHSPLVSRKQAGYLLELNRNVLPASLLAVAGVFCAYPTVCWVGVFLFGQIDHV